MAFKVFVARNIPEIGIQKLKKAGLQVVYNKSEKVLSKTQLKAKVKGKDALLSLLTDKVDDDILKTDGLKVVANYAVGYDNIDLKAATKRGVTVTNTPGVLNEAVAEHALALLFAASRRVVEADSYTRAGKYKAWGATLLMGQQIQGKTIGIVGAGRIGSELGFRCAKGLGMKVIYTDIKKSPLFEKATGGKYVSMAALLKQADFISLHVPLLPSTRHLISTKELKAMKKTAVLINTSRGPVVDQKALVNALKKREIFSAGLDVFECEPKLVCNGTNLKSTPNIVITPHIASATIEAREAMAVMAADAIIAIAKGEKPKHVVA